LNKNHQRKPAVVLPMTPGTSQRTLYFVHNAFDLSELNNALPGDIATACVAINDAQWLRELIGRGNILAAIDRISNAYAEAIIARHQTGSCCLAGYSFAGILAVETARKLDERGVTSDIIFLIDPYLQRYVYRVLYDIVHDGWLARKIRMLREDWRELARRASSHLRKARDRSSWPGRHNTDSEAELSSLFGELTEIASEAYRGPAHAPRSPTVLFRATKSLGGRRMHADRNLGWARHLGENLTIIPAPGDHFDLVKGDHARFVAAEIERRMTLMRATG
jgi:thioesterase domain-containing protein